jgi:Flp pilus assembly pilin Flp
MTAMVLRDRLGALLGDSRGQDMVEYALLAGFITVAAGALLPPIANDLAIIFNRLGSVLTVAAS